MKNNTLIATIIATVIAKSKELLAGSKEKPDNAKYASIKALWAEHAGQPFGCQSDRVAEVIYGITGFRPGGKKASLFKQFQAVGVKGSEQVGIVLADSKNGKVSIWTPGSKQDTFDFTIEQLESVKDKAVADALYAGIRRDKNAFVGVIKERINLSSLDLV